MCARARVHVSVRVRNIQTERETDRQRDRQTGRQTRIHSECHRNQKAGRV